MATATLQTTQMDLLIRMAAENLERSKRVMMDLFFGTRPKTPALSEEDIQAEVNAVRYGR